MYAISEFYVIDLKIDWKMRNLLQYFYLVWGNPINDKFVFTFVKNFDVECKCYEIKVYIWDNDNNNIFCNMIRRALETN